MHILEELVVFLVYLHHQVVVLEEEAQQLRLQDHIVQVLVKVEMDSMQVEDMVVPVVVASLVAEELIQIAASMMIKAEVADLVSLTTHNQNQITLQ